MSSPPTIPNNVLTTPNVAFNTINWANGINKDLKIEIDPTGVGTTYPVIGSNQLMSVPYALFAQSSQNSNSSIKTYNTINDLRTAQGVVGEIVYIKGHTSFGDGGQGNFILKNDTRVVGDTRFDDNDGTIISSSTSTSSRWVRLIDGKINIRYFGVIGYNLTDGDKIQKAIDFAAKNVVLSELYPVPIPANYLYFGNFSYAGTIVYIPSGNYLIKNTLKLCTGVSIEGEGMSNTILTADNTQSNGNMIEMNSGRIVGVSVSNLTLTGGDTKGKIGITKNAIHLKAQVGKNLDGGIWSSTFKNLSINQFNGCGIILEGGGGVGYQYNLPNQDLIFENIHIARQTDNTNCLLIQGQQGQMTFINCGFDGNLQGSLISGHITTSKFFNVVIDSKGSNQASVIKFLTCTFQYSEYGAFIRYAENITFDNCWFEQLDRAVGVVQSAGTSPAIPSKGINILNSRFANASGFGSYWNLVDNRNSITPNNSTDTPTGSCIYVEGSQVNVQNNFVTVSDSYNEANVFILNYGLDSDINSTNNSFKNYNSINLGKTINALGKTYGIANNTITPTNSTIETSSYKFLKVNVYSSNISEIKSNISAGETITIKANGLIKFDNAKNIIFAKASVTAAAPFVLNANETVTFMKIDNPITVNSVTYNETYVLIASNKLY